MLILYWPTPMEQIQLDDVDDDGVDRDVIVAAVTSEVSFESVHGLHNRALTTYLRNQMC